MNFGNNPWLFSLQCTTSHRCIFVVCISEQILGYSGFPFGGVPSGTYQNKKINQLMTVLLGELVFVSIFWVIKTEKIIGGSNALQLWLQIYKLLYITSSNLVFEFWDDALRFPDLLVIFRRQSIEKHCSPSVHGRDLHICSDIAS